MTTPGREVAADRVDPSRAPGTEVLRRLRPDELIYAWTGDRNTPMQIALLGVFDGAPFRLEDGGVDTARIRAELAVRAARVPELRRRVIWTRPGEGRPIWVEDATVDPLDAIAELALPSGADLPTWAANRAARGVSLDRPPWRIEVVDGLPGGRFAVLIVVSHVLADGLAGVALAGALLDARPDRAVPAPAPRTSPAVPTHAELRRQRRRECRAAVRRPRPRAGDHRAAAHPGMQQLRDALASFAGREPVTPMPRRIGPGRQLAVVRVPLAPLEETGHALGVTVNDLLLAAVTNGLRTFLVARGGVAPGLVLRTTVPATMRGAGHQVMAVLVVGLPVGEPDPRRQLALVHRSTTAEKARLRAAGGDLTDLRLPTFLARQLVHWTRRFGSHRLTLSVTDVPGPAGPLWLAGARLLETIPIAPMSQLVPLSVAALSYAGELVVSVNADAAIEGMSDLAEGTARGFAELARLRLEPAATRAGAGTA